MVDKDKYNRGDEEEYTFDDIDADDLGDDEFDAITEDGEVLTEERSSNLMRNFVIVCVFTVLCVAGYKVFGVYFTKPSQTQSDFVENARAVKKTVVEKAKNLTSMSDLMKKSSEKHAETERGLFKDLTPVPGDKQAASEEKSDEKKSRFNWRSFVRGNNDKQENAQATEQAAATTTPAEPAKQDSSNGKQKLFSSFFSKKESAAKADDKPANTQQANNSEEVDKFESMFGDNAAKPKADEMKSDSAADAKVSEQQPAADGMASIPEAVKQKTEDSAKALASKLSESVANAEPAADTTAEKSTEATTSATVESTTTTEPATPPTSASATEDSAATTKASEAAPQQDAMTHSAAAPAIPAQLQQQIAVIAADAQSSRQAMQQFESNLSTLQRSIDRLSSRIDAVSRNVDRANTSQRMDDIRSAVASALRSQSGTSARGWAPARRSVSIQPCYAVVEVKSYQAEVLRKYRTKPIRVQIGSTLPMLNSRSCSPVGGRTLRVSGIDRDNGLVLLSNGQAIGTGDTYVATAIIVGRAWLKSRSGATLTVDENSIVPGYGRVTRIDRDAGIIVTSSGRVINFVLE